MTSDLIRLTATEAVALLKQREVSPLELIDAAAERIASVEPQVNALPTLCLDRARDHAKRLMAGERREADDHCEGVVVEAAGLQLAHDARQHADGARAAVHDRTVDQGLIADLPEQRPEASPAATMFT